MQTENKEHPFFGLLLHYYNNFSKLRDCHLDMSSFDFQKNFGLFIQTVPNSWPYLDSVALLMNDVLKKINRSTKQIVVIYPSTKIYKSLSSQVDCDDILYMSWHEIYSSLALSNRDVRGINKYKESISNAELTLFIGAPALPELIDHVCGYCDGCLIILGPLQSEEI